jgi:hypothetical protein
MEVKSLFNRVRIPSKIAMDRPTGIEVSRLPYTHNPGHAIDSRYGFGSKPPSIHFGDDLVFTQILTARNHHPPVSELYDTSSPSVTSRTGTDDHKGDVQ